jgi:cobalt-zinc-cadmium resistance protein CzcA
MLYFAFDSVKEALIIYSAIPLSAVGGVLLLYIRGMPFSISAGVGFIALFGIAVLNGIVLIEEFKELKAHGIHNINRRILQGTRNRLRPVLLTAAAAALGFLPMAISTSAGAEVQRPLATVVVGGLISATALTLIVLPLLYAIFDRKRMPKLKMNAAMLLVLTFLALPFLSFGQQQISVEQAIESAIQNNKAIMASENRITQSEALRGAAYNFDKTQIFYGYDQNNISPEGLALNVFGISQSLQFPTIYGAQKKLQNNKVSMAMEQLNLDKRMISQEVSSAYYTVVYWQNVAKNYAFLDSLYLQFSEAAIKRYNAGETNYLEKLTAVSKQKEIEVLFRQSEEEIDKGYVQLQQWLQSDSTFTIPFQKLEKLKLVNSDIQTHPGIAYYNEIKRLNQSNLSLEKQRLLPDLHITLFQGSNAVSRSQGYNGIQAGIGIPLWFGDQKAKINAAKTQSMIIENEADNYQIQLQSRYDLIRSDLKNYQKALTYYEEEGKALGEELNLHAARAFESGEISFLQYVQFQENARKINMTYLDNLNKYNQAVLEANYLMN